MTCLCLELAEWDEAVPVVGQPLYGFHLPNDRTTRHQLQNLTQNRLLEIDQLQDGTRIRTTSFVGRVRLGPLTVTVRPKVTGFPLLRLLRYGLELRHIHFSVDAEFDAQQISFQDLLTMQLLAEVEELISRGLSRQYTIRREQLVSPRGRIDLQEYCRGLGQSQSTLPCRHHPRLLDCFPNQVLLSGLLLAARLADSLSLRSRCRRVASLINDDATTVPLNRETFQRWAHKRNRLTRAYDAAIRLIEFLVMGLGVSLERDVPSVDVPGFLFNMNVFFERLISRLLRDNLPQYTVLEQNRLKSLMQFVPGKNPKGRQNPTPRPDITLLQGFRVVRILDAKYRDLWEKELPRDMLYQLAIYALSQNTARDAIILYPAISDDPSDARIEIRNPLESAKPAWVTQRPVNLLKIAAMLEGSPKLEQDLSLKRYVEGLVGSNISNVPISRDYRIHP